MPSPENICTLIHTSDFHFRYPLTAAGRKLKSRLGTRTHSFHFIQAASEAIRRICLRYPDAALIASGDLTTLGDPTSFDLSRHFIERRSVSWEEIAHDVGLDFTNRYMVVPGNHDRYDDYPWEFQYVRFEDEFQHQLPRENFQQYGVVIHDGWERFHRRMPQVQVVQSADKGITVLMIGINSTAGASGVANNILRQIAQGYVPLDELQFVEKVMADVRRERVMLSTGEWFSLAGTRVFAMAVLHHHPYLPPDVDASFITRLINADEVIESCRVAGVNMLAYGHQHLAFVDPVTFGTRTPNATQLIFGASGSLSVHGEHANSFNVYHIDGSQIKYEIWEFAKGLFRPQMRTGSFGW